MKMNIFRFCSANVEVKLRRRRNQEIDHGVVLLISYQDK